MKNQYLKNVTELNLAILFISTSGVLGRYISIPPPLTIWWRCVFATLIIGLFCYFKKINLKISTTKDLKLIIVSGLFFGTHWVTYFYALQLSNVAIGMLSLFTYPVITALLEPLFFKTKFNSIHIFLGLLILIGIYFLTPEFNFENNYTKGILFGFISSIFYSLRNILLKKKVHNYDGSMLMFYQMLVLALILWPTFFIFNANPTTNEWSAIVLLALVTTALGHTLFIRSFKNFSVSSASIMSSIQPVYGILLGIFFLHEVPSVNTIIGGILIISTVIIESIQSNKRTL